MLTTDMDAIADLPFASIQHVILSTTVFIILWIAVNSYVAKRGALQWAEPLLETHNFIVASLSAVLAAYVADIGHNILDRKTGYSIDPSLLGYFYHVLKIYEHFDILLAAASGKSKITKYTAFSHLFLPWWSYFRIIARPDKNTDWRFQVIGDCLSRFASRAIPWLIEDLQTEQNLLNLAEEGRWYPDLAITAFWALFTFQGQRNDDQAIRSFGQPYPEETTARLLSVAVLLYASYAKRQDDESKKKPTTTNASTSKKTETSPVPSSVGPASLRQPSRRNR